MIDDFDLFYYFCLNWSMELVDRLELISQFRTYGWDYSSFERLAKKHNYFITSMLAIKYVN